VVTSSGHAMEIAVQLLGPLLLGLAAVLAVREPVSSPPSHGAWGAAYAVRYLVTPIAGICFRWTPAGPEDVQIGDYH
jgi:hypothetical protein